MIETGDFPTIDWCASVSTVLVPSFSEVARLAIAPEPVDAARRELVRRLRAMADRRLRHRTDRDLPGFTEATYEHEAFWTASHMLAQVEEHIIGFADDVEAERIFTPWTHARAVLEAGARAWWLTADDLTPEQIRDRTLATRHDAYEDLIRGWKALGRDTADLEDLRDKTAALIDYHDGKYGPPTKLDVTTLVLDGEYNASELEAPYRLLSAMTHAAPYSPLLVTKREATGDAPLGVWRAELELSTQLAAQIIVPGFIAYRRAVRSWLGRARAHVPVWTVAIERAGDAINAAQGA